MRRESLDFECLVKEIFQHLSCNLKSDWDDKFDMVFDWNDSEYVSEIKYYRTIRAQVSLINRAIFQFKRIKDARQDFIDDGVGGLLIISSYLESGLKNVIENEEDIVIVDLYDLLALTSELPEHREKLIKLLEIPDGLIDANKGRDLEEIFAREDSFHDRVYRSVPVEDDPQNNEQLISRLLDLPAGKKHWKSYETLMIEILKFLFEDDLKGWYTQYESENKLNRYDCVCGIKKTTEFWSLLIEQLKSNYLLIEFKNYSDEITQGEVLTTEKYLFENAFRKVALIFCRKGANHSALQMCMGAMRESGRLILVLDDKDVVEMIHSKENGSDPSDFLHQKVDDFLMRLSR